MNIGLDKLEYVFRRTDFAATDGFRVIRNGYAAGDIGARLAVDIDMSTPLSSSRTIGKWTLGGPLLPNIQQTKRRRVQHGDNEADDREV